MFMEDRLPMSSQHRAAIFLTLTSLAAPAYSQSSGTDVADRFYLEVGGFNLAADANLRLSTGNLGGTTIDFETDLDLPERETTTFLDAYWRVGRRHLLHVDFAAIRREGDGRSLDRDIEWGGQVYPVGVRLRGHVDSDYISGTYRFAAYRNDSFEVGPSLGLGYVWVTAGIEVEAAVGGASRLLDREQTTGSVTGNLGVYARWWPVRRLLFRGDIRYIKIEPENAEAELVDFSAGLTYYPWQKFGFGAHYSYDKLRYDRDILSSELGGSYRYSGFQLLASFAF
jgi:hypothetical protein